MKNINILEIELRQNANPQKAKAHQRFFKTKKGEYGEGDVFIGVTVPVLRNIAKKHWTNLDFTDIQKLLSSPIHEKRLLALFILRKIFEQKQGKITKREIVDFYLQNTKYVNNWDLVDSSSSYILGSYLHDNSDLNRNILYDLANSTNMWEQRIAILATHAFIKNESFSDTFKIAKILLNHEHDLIHKAIGWMLREVGKKNLEAEEAFLLKNYKKMPRTMLRYAIEHFNESSRQAYLKGKK